MEEIEQLQKMMDRALKEKAFFQMRFEKVQAELTAIKKKAFKVKDAENHDPNIVIPKNADSPKKVVGADDKVSPEATGDSVETSQ